MRMDYLASYTSTTIKYHTRDMCLHIDSDATNIILPKARSRDANHLYLSSIASISKAEPTPISDVSINTEYVTLRNVVTLAIEAETQTVYHNIKVVIPICMTIQELGHQEPPTPPKQTIAQLVEFQTNRCAKNAPKYLT